MIILNLSHPLTGEQRAQIERLTAQPIERLIERMPHFEPDQPLTEQIAALMDDLGLTATEWQTAPILVGLPGFAPAAASVLAELHGRCGYFPPVLRLHPVAGSLPPRFEVAEIVNLQAQREAARRGRSKE